VLARVNAGQVGEDINQPGAIDQNCGQSGSLADLTRFVTIQFWGKGRRPANYVDAAIAKIRYNGSTPSATNHILNLGPPSSTTAADAVGLTVYKTGRTTGTTSGKITAVDVTVNVGYSKSCGGPATLTATYLDQFVVVAPSGSPAFSAGGDSGSLILTSGKQPVGLLFAGNSTQTIANSIGRVITALHVNFEVPGAATTTTSGTTSSTALEPIKAAKARNSLRLMRARGVHGHGIGLSADGRAVIKVFVTPEEADAALAELPADVEGFPVEIEVTEPFVAY
jgi:hypothetical protein